MIRIWDTFLYEGSKVLFRYAVAIFLYNQDKLLAEGNSIAIFNQLRSMCKEATDVRRLTEISFNEITGFRWMQSAEKEITITNKSRVKLKHWTSYEQQ
ncbi:TBC1 domain family member 2A [Geodia barretti]|nr:TBC1 domain family member 2A [Geodia barretti]